MITSAAQKPLEFLARDKWTFDERVIFQRVVPLVRDKDQIFDQYRLDQVILKTSDIRFVEQLVLAKMKTKGLSQPNWMLRGPWSYNLYQKELLLCQDQFVTEPVAKIQFQLVLLSVWSKNVTSLKTKGLLQSNRIFEGP